MPGASPNPRFSCHRQQEDIEDARDKIVLGLERGNLALSEEDIIGSYDQARDVLKEHRHGLDELVEVLLEQEELSGQKVRDLLNGNKGH